MPIAQLDYPGAKILMQAETEVEQGFRLHACAKEPWTVAFVQSIPQGGVFWDIGANVGSYALIAASRGTVTVALEPSFSSYAKLCQNMMLNNFDDQIVPLSFALGDRDGFTWLDYQDTRSGAGSHVLGAPRKLFFHRQLIAVTTMDRLVCDYNAPPPTHVKIDVDGYEMPVLRGMERCLETITDLIVEMPLKHEAEISGWLEEHGYPLAERFDERGGQKIANICYGRFARQAAVVTRQITEHTESAVGRGAVIDVPPVPGYSSGGAKPYPLPEPEPAFAGPRMLGGVRPATGQWTT